MPMEKIIYKCREMELRENAGNYSVYISEEEIATHTNPLLAWNRFIEILDSRARRRIGDMLEKNGYNRYTGEKKKEEEESQ